MSSISFARYSTIHQCEYTPRAQYLTLSLRVVLPQQFNNLCHHQCECSLYCTGIRVVLYHDMRGE